MRDVYKRQAIDDTLCREGDNKTIGLLLCKTKDRIKAEYALRDIQKLSLIHI